MTYDKSEQKSFNFANLFSGQNFEDCGDIWMHIDKTIDVGLLSASQNKNFDKYKTLIKVDQQNDGSSIYQANTKKINEIIEETETNKQAQPKYKDIILFSRKNIKNQELKLFIENFLKQNYSKQTDVVFVGLLLQRSHILFIVSPYLQITYNLDIFYSFSDEQYHKTYDLSVDFFGVLQIISSLQEESFFDNRSNLIDDKELECAVLKYKQERERQFKERQKLEQDKKERERQDQERRKLEQDKQERERQFKEHQKLEQDEKERERQFKEHQKLEQDEKERERQFKVRLFVLCILLVVIVCVLILVYVFN